MKKTSQLRSSAYRDEKMVSPELQEVLSMLTSLEERPLTDMKR